MRYTFIFLASTFYCAYGQQIYDVFTTTWDRSSLFTYKNLSPSPINFQSGVAAGDAVINLTPDTVYQTMDGFGATLTDSSAQLMNNMKVSAERAVMISESLGGLRLPCISERGFAELLGPAWVLIRQ